MDSQTINAVILFIMRSIVLALSGFASVRLWSLIRKNTLLEQALCEVFFSWTLLLVWIAVWHTIHVFRLNASKDFLVVGRDYSWVPMLLVVAALIRLLIALNPKVKSGNGNGK